MRNIGICQYKITVEAQLEGMCKKLENEVAESGERAVRALFSVPKVRKGEESLQEQLTKTGDDMKSKKNKIPNNSGKRRKGISGYPRNTQILNEHIGPSFERI